MKHMLFGVTSAALLVAGFAFSGSAQEVQRINPQGMTQPTT